MTAASLASPASVYSDVSMMLPAGGSGGGDEWSPKSPSPPPSSTDYRPMGGFGTQSSEYRPMKGIEGDYASVSGAHGTSGYSTLASARGTYSTDAEMQREPQHYRRMQAADE